MDTPTASSNTPNVTAIPGLDREAEDEARDREWALPDERTPQSFLARVVSKDPDVLFSGTCVFYIEASSGERLEVTMVVSEKVPKRVGFWAPHDRGQVVAYKLFVCAFLSEGENQRIRIVHERSHKKWPVHVWGFAYVPGEPECESVDRGEPRSTI